MLVAGVLAITVTLGVSASVGAQEAHAHQTVNGIWTYRYFTRSDDGSAAYNCQANQGLVDPLNIINYQYGEFTRIFGHYQSETEWEPTSTGSHQVACITIDGSNYGTHAQYNQQDGHGVGGIIERAHFRLWSAGHVHPETTSA